MKCPKCGRKNQQKKKIKKFKEFDNWREFMDSNLKRILTKEKTYASWKKERDKIYKGNAKRNTLN